MSLPEETVGGTQHPRSLRCASSKELTSKVLYPACLGTHPMGFGKDGKGAILREFVSIDLGTLAGSTVVKASANLVLQDDFRILKTEYLAFMEEDLADDGEAVFFGIADNELSIAEIAELLVLSGPLDRNDRLSTERAERPVWNCGLFKGVALPVLNNGMLIERSGKPWTFSNPEGWTWYAFNPTAAALGDANASAIKIMATHYGVWVT